MFFPSKIHSKGEFFSLKFEQIFIVMKIIPNKVISIPLAVISKTVVILLISSFITKKCPNY